MDGEGRQPESSGWGIIIEGFTKRYDDLVAVNSLTLCVRRGELFTFLGPNGAGKTTAVRVLTTLLRADSGEASAAQAFRFSPSVRKRAGTEISRQPSPAWLSYWPASSRMTSSRRCRG